jgi:murein L,D-transpeptidase YafK
VIHLNRSRVLALVLPIMLAVGVTGCEERSSLPSKHYVQVSPQTLALMSSKGMTRNDAVLIRSYKQESELEVWKKTSSGEYALLKTFPMCRWSGQLGPKAKEGDRQAPEGFYTITPAQMNPNSSFHLSFNIGYPNAFDRAYGRSGSHLMVHGACSSRGCYSMTDEQIQEIYALVRDAHSGGQSAVQMQALPFRMTAENIAKHRANPHIGFWKNLKEGSDHFDVTKKEPKTAVCGRKYVFNAAGSDGDTRFDASSSCPPLKVDEQIASAVSQKQHRDNQQVADLVAKGTPAIKLVYDDGDQHHSFKGTSFATVNDDRATTASIQRPMVAGVSRPEALVNDPKVVALETPNTVTPTLTASVVTASASQTVVPEKLQEKPQEKTVLAVVEKTATKSSTPLAVAAAEPVSASVVEEKPFYARLTSPMKGLFGAKETSGETTASTPLAPAQPELESLSQSGDISAHPEPTPRPRSASLNVDAVKAKLKDTPASLPKSQNITSQGFR